MFQLRIGKDGRQIIQAKSASHFKDSTSSTLSEGQVSSQLLPPEHLPKSENPQNDSQPFSIRINSGNVHNYMSLKDCEVKEAHVKRIGEALLELRRSITAYRYLEKEEVRAKQNIYVWFHEAENLFLSSLSGDYNLGEAQKVVEEHVEMSTTRPLTPRHAPKVHPPSLLPNFYQQQAQALRVEVQAFRRNSMEELKKLEEISSLFSTLKGKYNAEKMTNKALNEAMELYIDECDTILERITVKYQKERAVTGLEREMQQILTKLKFKTFNYHYRS